MNRPRKEIRERAPERRRDLPSPPRREAIFALIALICVIADQATKALATLYLEPGVVVPFIPGILNFALVHNTGAAFSMGEGYSWLFAMIALVVVGLLAWLLWTSDGVPVVLCVLAGVVAGGGIGNFIDRVSRGSVIDFFATAFVDFPVFNVADICVTVGIIAGCIGMLWWDRQQARATRPPSPPPDIPSTSLRKD